MSTPVAVTLHDDNIVSGTSAGTSGIAPTVIAATTPLGPVAITGAEIWTSFGNRAFSSASGCGKSACDHELPSSVLVATA
jgi:hypothetical protein